MTPQTCLLFCSSSRRKLILYNFLILIFIFSTKGLDIQLDDLLVLSQFHCFNVNKICTSRLEYCSSFARECRPCSADICAKRGGDDFPLQCSLNCSIADAKIKESNRTFQSVVESNAYLWFLLLITLVPVSILVTGCLCKIRRLKRLFRKITRNKKSTADEEYGLTTVEERGLVQPEENTSKEPYCEVKFKGMCETNEDKQMTIATTQDKGFSTPSRMNSALQQETATSVTEDKKSDRTESELDEDTCSKEAADKSGLDFAPLNAGPSLDFKTFDGDEKNYSFTAY